MKKQTIRLNENQLYNLVKKAVINTINESVQDNFENAKKKLNEGESGGWVVEPSEAEEAYNMFAAELGNEEANAAIVRALGNSVLSDVLAYLFRMYDFRQWDERDTQY